MGPSSAGPDVVEIGTPTVVRGEGPEVLEVVAHLGLDELAVDQQAVVGTG